MNIQLQSVPAHWVAYRRATCWHEEIGSIITSPQMLGAVYEFASGNLGESRAPYARYLEWRESDCDLQAGVQLAGPMQSTDGTTTDHYSACKALVGVFMGPYHQLVDAHAEIRAYANAEGHVLSGPCWEVYDGPPAEDGTAKTVIYYPVLQ